MLPVLLTLITSATASLTVSGTPPDDAGIPLQSFISFSIEFSSFPDFAGNTSHPNTFSYNLLKNLGDLQGSDPYIRVGGNTQDFAIFNASLPVASVGVVDPALSPDYPTTLTIGPSYFESYNTWPGFKYIHGFNLGRNTTAAREATYDSATYACKAIGGKLLYWELGNEPDLFARPGGARPPTYDEQDYVNDWLQGTRRIREVVGKACPELAAATYYAPSFAGTGNQLLQLNETFEAGLDDDRSVGIISSHNYIAGAMSPGVTLQGTLMNHSSTVASVQAHIDEKRRAEQLPQAEDLMYILGEGNSLYRQGRPGLSNSFGAALWSVDFSLYCAANNIQRFHLHQGTNYRYQSWQPIETDLASKRTKAPYYGNIAAAAFLGNAPASSTKIANIPREVDTEAAYAAYVDDKLVRVIIINMQEYNATAGNDYINDYPRPNVKYELKLPESVRAGISVQLQRLLANGSDAITGVTFDGYSYNEELDNGKPVCLHNVTRGETVIVGEGGQLEVEVPRSSAVILSFDD